MRGLAVPNSIGQCFIQYVVDIVKQMFRGVQVGRLNRHVEVAVPLCAEFPNKPSDVIIQIDPFEMGLRT